jgi:hypothetical protein
MASRKNFPERLEARRQRAAERNAQKTQRLINSPVATRSGTQSKSGLLKALINKGGFRVRVSAEVKRGCLIPVTGLVVGYVRHGINKQWGAWDSIEQILGYWFIHTIALVLFMVISSAIILQLHEFFLGYKAEGRTEEELPVYVLMTVLIGAVAIFLMSHWVPSDDSDG